MSVAGPPGEGAEAGTPVPVTNVVVRLDREHPPGLRERAEQKVRAALQHARGPVREARVRIRRHPDPAAEPPVIAEATVDVDGHPVRAHVGAATGGEAVDLLQDKLRACLVRDRHRHAASWEDRRGAEPKPGGWRHGQPVPPRPPYFPRPAEERQIVRHKSFSVDPVDLDEAAFDLDVLDHDFHLIVEVGTGQDGVLYRTADGLRFALTDPHTGELAAHEVPVQLSPHPAPLLTTAEARERLGLLGLPFLFFLDADRGRGAVLHLRYDGHYGLVTVG